ncbi:MAG TPA: ABC transporter permease [Ignavibacteriaceae bacterium]|nr:ABC transporter permease [Ignavibacteriaceae bacterium]
MLKNYLKIAFRNLRTHKAYSYINISGLAIGIACCLLILLYIHDELSYDSFHEKADRIFRINTDIKLGPTELHIPVVSDMMGQLLKQDYPQIEEYTRIYNFDGDKLIKKGDQYNNEKRAAYVDSTFFKVFTFPAIYGNTDRILNEPNTVVITKSAAERYFGTADVLGRSLEIKDADDKQYKITAIIEDMPSNSHFRFDFLLPMQNCHYEWGNLVSSNFHTYLLLKEGVNYKEFEKKFIDYNYKYVLPYARDLSIINSLEEFEKAGNKIENSLTPLTDIHLYSNRIQEISPTGTIQYVYIFSGVALFILLIACINFMNLTTARSANRAREVGIRKVLGTARKNLVFQFLAESTLMSLFAVILAVLIVFYVLPFFNNISGKELAIGSLFSGSILIFLLVLPFLIGFIAGGYPSLFLSRFMPVEVMKGKFSGGSKSGSLRNALVVFQFATSIALITGTIIIYNQLNYIQSKNLGYQKDQVLILNDTYALGNNVEAFKNEMLDIPGVKSGTVSGFLPIPSERSNSAFYREASNLSEGGLSMQRWRIDYDYLKTLGIQVVNGRNFSREFGTDSSAIILNEVAIKQLGYKNPIGEKLYTWEQGGALVSYDIIGIVKNFNFESLHQEIGPLCLSLDKSTGHISFKVNAASITVILKEAEKKWKVLVPEMPFSYSFMDEHFNEVYGAERRVGTIALSFSALAILIACLGLFGLATFLAEQKTKEIGIRKVLGASVPSVLLMLSKEFIKWIIIANVIAWPLAYYFMNKWLQDFAYRIELSLWLFIIAGFIALVIALLTISIQAIKAATANPVESLRYE